MQIAICDDEKSIGLILERKNKEIITGCSNRKIFIW